MSYTPANPPTDPLAGYTHAELVKIAATLRVHEDAFVSMAARIQALEMRPIYTPPPPPAPSAKVLFAWPATTVAPFGIHAKDPSRVTLVNVGGRPGVRLQTLPGDNNVNGSREHERSDLRLGNDLSFAKEGNRVKFDHSVWFPSDFPDLPESPLNAQPWYWGSFFNWHDDRDTGSSQGPVQGMFFPPTGVSADRPTGLVYQMFGGTTGNTRLAQPKIGPVVREKWYDFESEIYWTSKADGFYDTKLNGQPIFTYKGPTLHAGAGAYLKLANYHVAFGKSVAIIHGAMEILQA
jgi:hypothetical protein